MAGQASSLSPTRSPLRCAAGMGRDVPPVVKNGAPYVATVGGSKVRRGGGWGSSVVCSPLANGAAGPAPTCFFMPRAAPSLNTRQGRVRPSGGAGRRRGPYREGPPQWPGPAAVRWHPLVSRLRTSLAEVGWGRGGRLSHRRLPSVPLLPECPGRALPGGSGRASAMKAHRTAPRRVKPPRGGDVTAPPPPTAP